MTFEAISDIEKLEERARKEMEEADKRIMSIFMVRDFR
jgi:hypothetical protein